MRLFSRSGNRMDVLKRPQSGSAGVWPEAFRAVEAAGPGVLVRRYWASSSNRVGAGPDHLTRPRPAAAGPVPPTSRFARQATPAPPGPGSPEFF
jgi:hypothetical protein